MSKLTGACGARIIYRGSGSSTRGEWAERPHEEGKGLILSEPGFDWQLIDLLQMENYEKKGVYCDIHLALYAIQAV